MEPDFSGRHQRKISEMNLRGTQETTDSSSINMISSTILAMMIIIEYFKEEANLFQFIAK
jgi:hypothetical protein